MTFVRLVLSASLLAAACTAPDSLADTSHALSGAGDLADRECQVVLRQVARVPDGSAGWLTSERGSWIWEGTLDVSADAVAEGATPAVLFQYGSNPSWHEAAAVEATPGDDFVRYRFRLEGELPHPGMSATGLSRARVRVIPLLHLAGGARLFDHNRRPGDFDSYELSATEGFAIRDDASACAPPATLRFEVSWNETQNAPIAPGGTMTVAYELARLGACRATHNGYPAWDLVAHARFEPGGQHASASVRAFETVNGFPTTIAHARHARFDVPADATSVALWFENYGIACQAWDSDFGRNYRFEVAPE